MLLAGSILERVGESEEIARPLSIVVKPADTEHADDFGAEGAQTIQILLPEDAARELSRFAPGNGSWRWMHAGPSVAAFLTLLREFRHSGPDSMRVHDAAVDAISAIAINARPSFSSPPKWIALVREALDDRDDPAPVSVLALEAGVHPVYLARQFRRWFDCSITDYLRRRRVQRAARNIANSRGALSIASYESGFSDQAHMCRVFKAETGLTPGSFRKLVACEVSTVQFQREARH
jgi:AraC family transcriptional regulator